jgi:hypothetical protein
MEILQSRISALVTSQCMQDNGYYKASSIHVHIPVIILCTGAGAILQSRISALVYGAPQPRLGADGSWVSLFPASSALVEAPMATITPPTPKGHHHVIEGQPVHAAFTPTAAHSNPATTDTAVGSVWFLPLHTSDSAPANPPSSLFPSSYSASALNEDDKIGTASAHRSHARDSGSSNTGRIGTPYKRGLSNNNGNLARGSGAAHSSDQCVSSDDDSSGGAAHSVAAHEHQAVAVQRDSTLTDHRNTGQFDKETGSATPCKSPPPMSEAACTPSPHPFHNQIQVRNGVLRDECAQVRACEYVNVPLAL